MPLIIFIIRFFLHMILDEYSEWEGDHDLSIYPYSFLPGSMQDERGSARLLQV